MEETSPLARGQRWRRALLAWGLFGLLLLFQWALFQRRLDHELAGAIPRGYDQAVYLDWGHRVCDRVTTTGPAQALREALVLPVPTGLLLHTQAGFLFEWFGPSRAAALSLHFVWFALFQAVLLATLFHQARSWRVAFFGLGLLLTVRSPFVAFGSMTNFRIDFIAFSVFGVFLCAVVRSGCFASWRWSLAAGAVAAVLVLYRYLTIVYLSGALGLCALFFALGAYLARAPEGRQLARSRLIGVLLCGGLLVLAVAPVLFLQRENLWNYYVANHLLGAEKDVRAAELGVFTRAQSLLYYARSLIQIHTSASFLVLAGLGLLVSLLTPRSGGEAGKPRLGPLFVVGACLLVPYTVLTLNVAKSPIVGSILVPPLLLLALLPLAGRAGGRPSFLLTAVMVLAVGIGCRFQFNNSRGLPAQEQEMASNAALLAVHDELVARCDALGLREPVVSVDAVDDLLSGPAFNVVARERHGLPLDVHQALGSALLEADAARALACVQRSDFVLLTDGCLPEVSAYPFTQAMRGLRPRLREHCQRNLVLIKEVSVRGLPLRLYARPDVVATAQARQR